MKNAVQAPVDKKPAIEKREMVARAWSALQTLALKTDELGLESGVNALKGRPITLGFYFSKKDKPTYVVYPVNPVDIGSMRLFAYAQGTQDLYEVRAEIPVAAPEVTVIASADSKEARKLAAIVNKQYNGRALDMEMRFDPIKITDMHNEQVLLYLEYAEIEAVC